MEALLAALRQLDAMSDEQWLEDTTPDLEYLAGLLGAPVTAEEVEAAWPGFNRTVAFEAAQQAEAGATEPQQPPAAETPVEPEPTASEPESEPTATDSEPQADEEDRLAEQTDDPVAELRQKLDEARKVVDARLQDVTDAQNALAEAQAEADTVVNELAELEKASNSDVRGYFARQAQMREERAARIREIQESGVDLRAVAASTSGAPIDNAMARRSGFGGKRPQRG